MPHVELHDETADRCSLDSPTLLRHEADTPQSPVPVERTSPEICEVRRDGLESSMQSATDRGKFDFVSVSICE
jgi:hypothetical protein